ncbi:hypothetical protein D3C81_2068820 [compost metagenome]
MLAGCQEQADIEPVLADQRVQRLVQRREVAAGADGDAAAPAVRAPAQGVQRLLHGVRLFGQQIGAAAGVVADFGGQGELRVELQGQVAVPRRLAGHE